MLPTDLADTLDALGPALAELRHDWWLIGSTAMALLGVEDLRIGDVDVLAHPDDARALLERLGAGWSAGEPSARFHSGVYGRWRGAAIEVDVFGDFRVRSADGWVPMRPSTRRPVDRGGFRFWTPTVEEMIAICRLFGRPKDLERAARLEALLGAPFRPENDDRKIGRTGV